MKSKVNNIKLRGQIIKTIKYTLAYDPQQIYYKLNAES